MRRAQLALASLVIARNSRKSPLEGIKSLATLETEASRMNGDFLWAYKTTWWEFESRGAKQKAVATFPKSRSVLGQIYKVPLGGY